MPSRRQGTRKGKVHRGFALSLRAPLLLDSASAVFVGDRYNHCNRTSRLRVTFFASLDDEDD